MVKPDMATKAELFRYKQERMGPKRPPSATAAATGHPVNTALPGVSATDRKVGENATGGRNVSKSAARKAPYQLEDSRTVPSRKSTRRGANKQRQDNSLWERVLRVRRRRRRGHAAAAEVRVGTPVPPRLSASCARFCATFSPRSYPPPATGVVRDVR